MQIRSIKLYGSNVEILSDWRQASAWFLENSKFSAFFHSYKKHLYKKTV